MIFRRIRRRFLLSIFIGFWGSYAFATSFSKIPNSYRTLDSLIYKARNLLYFSPSSDVIPLLDSVISKSDINNNYGIYYRAQKLKFVNFQLKYLPEQSKNVLLEIDTFLLKRKELINYDSLFIQNLNNWGVYFYSIEYLKKAEEIFSTYIIAVQKYRYERDNCNNLLSVYRFLSAIYEKTGAYEAAIQTSLNSFQYFDCNQESRKTSNQSQAYFAIANLYVKNSDYGNADKYFELARVELEGLKKETADYNREIVLSYCRLAEYEIGKQMYEQAHEYLDSAMTRFDKTDVFRIQTYTILGDLQKAQGDIYKALDSYLFALSAYQKLQGTNSLELGIVNRKIGDTYQQIGQMESALDYYHASIRSLVFDFDPAVDSETSFPFDRILSSLELMQTLDGKAGLLLEQYAQTEEQALLQEAEQTTSLALSIFDRSRFDLVQQEDRQRQLALAYPLYEKAIQTKQLLYQLEPKEATIQELLTLMGQSKGLGVSEMANHLLANDQRFTDIFEEERQWKTQIANVEKAIFSKLSRGEDPDTFQDLLDQEKQLKYDFVRWNQDVQRNHPDYFALKLSQESVSLDKIRQDLLGSNQGLIEYFWGEKHLFAVYLSQKHMGVQRIELSGIRDTLHQFLSLLNDQYSRESRSAQAKLQQLSHRLYQGLLAKPLADFGPDTDELILIRDGLLGSLPVELLSQKKANDGFYRPDQFLIQDYVVSYAYSLPMLLKQKQLGQLRTGEKAAFAGFAPTYEMPQSPPDSTGVLAFLTRSGYLPLPGAKEEVRAIRKMIGGRVFKDRSASEAQFKAKAGRYDLLHLAMHAVPDNRDPQFSSLIFSLEEDDTVEDGHLQAIEIYNMQLHASMVVLSACNTGYGEWQRGEGIVSLGHAFTYAGVPSTVLSHWKVPDDATAEIMKLFYQNLQQHQPKDVALANAKRMLLAQRPEWSHPVFWAGFVAVGDMEPLELASGNTLVNSPVFYAVLIVVLISFLLIRNKAFRQK